MKSAGIKKSKLKSKLMKQRRFHHDYMPSFEVDKAAERWRKAYIIVSDDGGASCFRDY
jgi:hypothetical protein